MNKYIVEFIGTFFFVLTIGMTVVEPGAAGLMAPIAIGLSLAVMIFAGGHISGGHYNPAVSLSVYLRGKLNGTELLPYIAAQIAAAAVAALVVIYFKNNPITSPKIIPAVPGLLAEFLFTFALAWVVLNVATAEKTAGNSFYGFAIGLTVTVGAYAVGGISGGAFNPAVVIGLAVMGVIAWADIWIHLAGSLAGASLAALAFKALAGK